jgi:hypothetical protein
VILFFLLLLCIIILHQERKISNIDRSIIEVRKEINAQISFVYEKIYEKINAIIDIRVDKIKGELNTIIDPLIRKELNPILAELRRLRIELDDTVQTAELINHTSKFLDEIQRNSGDFIEFIKRIKAEL